MIKLILFDFDNVLADCKEIHYLSLNEALEFYNYPSITHEQQISTFEGLPTKTKLSLLNIPEHHFNLINCLKQQRTAELIKTHLKPSTVLKSILARLNSQGYNLQVVSNAIRQTVVQGLSALDILNQFSKIYSNEDSDLNKPNPKIYLKAIQEANVSPFETLVLEDSRAGREAAFLSGATLCPIDSPQDITYEHISKYLNKNNISVPWKDSKLVTLIPMCGNGSRMNSNLPKFLIDVDYQPMIKRAIDCLNVESDFIFIIRREHEDRFNASSTLKCIVPNPTIIYTNSLPPGQLATCLEARDILKHYYSNHRLFLANCDQLISWNSPDFFYRQINSNNDGSILTFNVNDQSKKWSYSKVDNNNLISEVREKEPISNYANTGLYYFTKVSDFLHYGDQVISKNIRTNNEFYTSAIFQEMIQDNKKISNYTIDNFYPIGTEEDLSNYLKGK